MQRRETKRPSVAEKAKRGRRNGRITLLATVALAGILTVGGTVAYLTAETSDVTNTMTPATVTCAVIDGGLNDSDGKEICVRNTGNIHAYIRAAITVNWVKVVDGVTHVYGTPPSPSADYELKLGSSTGWGAQSSDGFYYYTLKVAPGASTGALIDSCTLRAGASVPAGYSLVVDVAASAIQALPETAVETEWGATVDDVHKTLSKA